MGRREGRVMDSRFKVFLPPDERVIRVCVERGIVLAVMGVTLLADKVLRMRED